MFPNPWDYGVHARYRQDELLKDRHPLRNRSSTPALDHPSRRRAGIWLIALGERLAGIQTRRVPEFPRGHVTQ